MSRAARETILGAIRKRLREARLGEGLPEDRDAVGPAPRHRLLDADAEQLLTAFRARIEPLGVLVHEVGGLDEALELVRARLRDAGARTVACSDAAALSDLLSRELEAGFQAVDPGDSEALFGADAGVCCAQAGIAETGSLVLDADRERHRLVSLIPPLHIALLHRDRVVPDLATALRDALTEGRAPTALTLITGPSRTADIELKLVVGVHGPKALEIVVHGD